jgi:hypothetical protein
VLLEQHPGFLRPAPVRGQVHQGATTELWIELERAH